MALSKRDTAADKSLRLSLLKRKLADVGIDLGDESTPGSVLLGAILQPPAPSPVRPINARSKRGRATWIPSGGRIVVHGRSIGGGMVYVGSDVPSVNGYSIEPCLIDQDLAVDWKKSRWVRKTTVYWPSDDRPAYNHIDPGERAAYLGWLAGGRRDKFAYIGNVLLFFYGLERRLFADLGSVLDHPEVEIIVAEVERLLGIYGADHSFSGYANSLLAFIEGLMCVQQGSPSRPVGSQSQGTGSSFRGQGRYRKIHSERVEDPCQVGAQLPPSPPGDTTKDAGTTLSNRVR